MTPARREASKEVTRSVGRHVRLLFLKHKMGAQPEPARAGARGAAQPALAE